MAEIALYVFVGFFALWPLWLPRLCDRLLGPRPPRAGSKGVYILPSNIDPTLHMDGLPTGLPTGLPPGSRVALKKAGRRPVRLRHLLRDDAERGLRRLVLRREGMGEHRRPKAYCYGRKPVKDAYSYHVTTGPVREMVFHARRKRRDHAEAVARRLSAKYPEETYRVWQDRERDSAISTVGVFRDGEPIIHRGYVDQLPPTPEQAQDMRENYRRAKARRSPTETSGPDA
jgi:hypothetical protein